MYSLEKNGKFTNVVAGTPKRVSPLLQKKVATPHVHVPFQIFFTL